MSRISRTARRAAALATTATFLTVSAAWAHPAFNPSELPSGSQVETKLVIPHGCGDGRDVATTAIEIQWDEAVSPMPMETDGWAPFVEDGTAWGWNDSGGSTTEVIELPLMVTVEGEVGTELDLVVRQVCDDEVNLWGAGDDAFPALHVVVAEGLGDEGEIDHSDHDMGDEAMDDMADDAMADGGMVDSAMGEGADDAETVGLDGDEAASDDVGSNAGVLIGVLVAAVVLGGGAASMAMRKRA